MSMSLSRKVSLLSLCTTFLFSGVALAGSPQLDNGQTIATDKPYESAQEITSVFQSKSVYGKLTKESTADIYRFKADKDGEQVISMLSKDAEKEGQPILILMDPTDSTKAEDLGLPTPSDDYHAAIITPIKQDQSFTEPLVLQKYKVTASDKYKLKKDTTYYLVVIEPYGQPANYVIKLGDGKSWGAADLIKNIPSWFKIQTDAFGGATPFTFPAGIVGLLVLLLGVIVLSGVFVIESAFAFLSFRYATASYLLVKVQPISRVAIWLSLWFTAVGMYLHFGHFGWNGIPFVLIILFIAILVSFLLYTLRFSRQLGKIVVADEAAVISPRMHKIQAAYFVINLALIVSFVTLLSMFLLAK